MKILFVLENYLPHIGGVEIVFKNLCEGLARKGHVVTVVTHRIPGTKKEERINGVRIVRVSSLDSRYLFTFTAIPKVFKLAKHADIIHTTTYNGAFPAWIASRGKPKIITVHETWLGKWKEYSNFSNVSAWLHELLEWFVYHIPRFNRYVCVSESTGEMLTQALPAKRNRILTIHNGFTPRKITGEDLKEALHIRKEYKLEGKYVLFAAGRPGTTKGFEYLLKAFPEIKKRIPNAALILMLSTDRQYRHKMGEFKKEAHKDILFLNTQPHNKLNAYRAASDVIIVPSITEGFGYAVLEACASGVPVVATNTTSIPEVIYGKHVLVKPKSAAAIVEGVLKVKKGKYENTPAKSFPWPKTISAYEKLYRKLVRR